MGDLVERLKAEAVHACKLSDDGLTNENWDDLDEHVAALACMSLLFSEAAAEIARLREALRYVEKQTAHLHGLAHVTGRVRAALARAAAIRGGGA